MGTEYCLGKHGKEKTPQGDGIHLMAYEMSGEFDVYIDLPKERVDMDAWDDASKNAESDRSRPSSISGCAARVNLWEHVDPIKLFEIGLNIITIASLNAEGDKRTGDRKMIRAKMAEWLDK